MEDSSYNNARTAAVDIGRLLSDHKGGEVVVMDLSGMNAWTDFFIIATVTSSAHLQGLHKHIKEHLVSTPLTILRRQRKTPADEEWSLIDLGSIVVHLMTDRARRFYELERLWSDAEIAWRSEG